MNTAWNGAGIVDLLNDDGTLDPGDAFTLQLVVTLDPDAWTSFPTPITNQVTVSADDPNDPNNETSVTDLSDSGSDPDSSNDAAPGANPGNRDDPTPIIIQDIDVLKSLTSAVPAASLSLIHI